MHIHSHFLVIAGAQLAVATKVGYFESDDCADPSGFISCYQDADEWYTDCMNNNCEGLNTDCHDACECAHQGAYTRCAVGSCWNMVYSCEYQMQATDNINSCLNPDLDDIPFWPAPDNADGRCSCPIGRVTTAQVLSNQVIAQCGNNADPFSQTPEEIEAYGMACLCCGVSGFLSSLPSICPKLNPAELSMDVLEDVIIENMPAPKWTECGQWMSGYDCADFGLPSDIRTFYAPGQVPEGGTETLNNIGSLQTPASDVVTFTIGGDLFPVTAVSTNIPVPTGSRETSEHGNNSNDNSSGGSSGSDVETDSSENTEDGDNGSSKEQADSGIHQMSVNPASLFMALAVSTIAYML